MVLFRRAIKGGYNLTPEQRQRIVQRASEILDAPPELATAKDGEALGVSYRDQLAAAKVLLAADKLDLEAEKMERGQGGTTINVSGNMNVADLRGVDLEALKAAKLRAINGTTKD
jgi:hypothetical protein